MHQPIKIIKCLQRAYIKLVTIFGHQHKQHIWLHLMMQNTHRIVLNRQLNERIRTSNIITKQFCSLIMQFVGEKWLIACNTTQLTIEIMWMWTQNSRCDKSDKNIFVLALAKCRRKKDLYTLWLSRTRFGWHNIRNWYRNQVFLYWISSFGLRTNEIRFG